jgi:hypothetical protein
MAGALIKALCHTSSETVKTNAETRKRKREILLQLPLILSLARRSARIHCRRHYCVCKLALFGTRKFLSTWQQCGWQSFGPSEGSFRLSAGIWNFLLQIAQVCGHKKFNFPVALTLATALIYSNWFILHARRPCTMLRRDACRTHVCNICAPRKVSPKTNFQVTKIFTNDEHKSWNIYLVICWIVSFKTLMKVQGLINYQLQILSSIMHFQTYIGWLLLWFFCNLKYLLNIQTIWKQIYASFARH